MNETPKIQTLNFNLKGEPDGKCLKVTQNIEVSCSKGLLKDGLAIYVRMLLDSKAVNPNEVVLITSAVLAEYETRKETN